MEEKVGFFKRLKNGLSKTRDSFVSGIDSLFTGFSEIDDDFYEELEELLVMGDIGINTTMSIIENSSAKRSGILGSYTRSFSDLRPKS